MLPISLYNLAAVTGASITCIPKVVVADVKCSQAATRLQHTGGSRSAAVA
jgi:hypothetical protein